MLSRLDSGGVADNRFNNTERIPAVSLRVTRVDMMVSDEFAEMGLYTDDQILSRFAGSMGSMEEEENSDQNLNSHVSSS